MKVQCISIQQRLTGHNDQQEYVYSFIPEIVFGIQKERLTGDLSFHSFWSNKFVLGERYELEIK